MQPSQRKTLLNIAHQSIVSGLEKGVPGMPDSTDPVFMVAGASFVTLNHEHRLRGCIGSLHASRPLQQDVAINAFNAAFRDPRFPLLQADELPGLEIHISILSNTTPLDFTSEADLLRQLRPGIDGLVLSDGSQRATFLPQVWETLPDPADFVQHLKQKAGLSKHYWSPTIAMERYTVESIDPV